MTDERNPNANGSVTARFNFGRVAWRDDLSSVELRDGTVQVWFGIFFVSVRNFSKTAQKRVKNLANFLRFFGKIISRFKKQKVNRIKGFRALSLEDSLGVSLWGSLWGSL